MAIVPLRSAIRVEKTTLMGRNSIGHHQTPRRSSSFCTSVRVSYGESSVLDSRTIARVHPALPSSASIAIIRIMRKLMCSLCFRFGATRDSMPV